MTQTSQESTTPRPEQTPKPAQVDPQRRRPPISVGCDCCAPKQK